REDEALALAEQLAMISTPEAIQLRNAQVLVNHFLDPEIALAEQMPREEALSVLRSCVATFLAESSETILEPFVQLRNKLATETLSTETPEMEHLSASPYFLLHTTLTVLLTQLRVATNAELEHAAANVQVLLPILWSRLRDKDRWQTGETFALVHHSG